MLRQLYLLGGASALALLAITPVLAVDNTRDKSTVINLSQAPTSLDAMHMLDSSDRWLYDFKTQCDNFTFNPGSVCNANRATWPVITGHGMTMAMLNLGPCAILPPHFHARASNYVVAISGTTTTYMIAENGAGIITTNLTEGKLTIFPQGSIHTMVNTGKSPTPSPNCRILTASKGCDNAQLISALSSEDAGTTNIANGLFMLPEDIVSRVLSGLSDYNETMHGIPPFGTGSNSGSEECLARCNSQQENQRDEVSHTMFPYSNLSLLQCASNSISIKRLTLLQHQPLNPQHLSTHHNVCHQAPHQGILHLFGWLL